MSFTAHLLLQRFVAGQASAEVKLNTILDLLDTLVQPTILGRTLTSPPGSPDAGDRYIPAATATGDWAGLEDQIVVYLNGGWTAIEAEIGWEVFDVSTSELIRLTASGWSRRSLNKVETGIVASATQTQGQQPLTAQINVVETVATVDDVVTLPPAEAGLECTIFNRAASRVQVYPASGDSISALSVDASDSVAAAAVKRYVAVDSTRWLAG